MPPVPKAPTQSTISNRRTHVISQLADSIQSFVATSQKKSKPDQTEHTSAADNGITQQGTKSQCRRHGNQELAITRMKPNLYSYIHNSLFSLTLT